MINQISSTITIKNIGIDKKYTSNMQHYSRGLQIIILIVVATSPENYLKRKK